MGNHYTNLSIRGADFEAVVEAVRAANRRAFVLDPGDGWIVVFDEACDRQDEAEIRTLGRALCSVLARPGLAALNHDDDVLVFWLFDASGAVADEFGVGAFEDEAPPAIRDVPAMCRLLETDADPDEVAAILEEQPLMVVDVHDALTQAMGLPACTAGNSYGDLERGSSDEDFQGRLAHVHRRRVDRREAALAGAPPPARPPAEERKARAASRRALQRVESILDELSGRKNPASVLAPLLSGLDADGEDYVATLLLDTPDVLSRLESSAWTVKDAGQREALGRVIAWARQLAGQLEEQDEPAEAEPEPDDPPAAEEPAPDPERMREAAKEIVRSLRRVPHAEALGPALAFPELPDDFLEALAAALREEPELLAAIRATVKQMRMPSHRFAVERLLRLTD